MKFAAFFVLLPTLAAQEAPAEKKPEQLASIEGKILNAATGEPLRKANLILRSVEVPPGGYPATYMTATGADGKFAMKDLAPGKYRLHSSRAGFVNAEYGARSRGQGTTITLAAGQKASEIDVKMMPHGVIAGRILDSDGEPVPNVNVTPMTYRYTPRGRQLTSAAYSSTNDLGEFRVFGLAPGRYLLQANYSMRWDMAVDRSAREGPEEGYVPTYFPGVTDPASAAQIEVTAGQQLLGVEVRLSKTRTLRIRGRVQNLSGLSMGRATAVRVTLLNKGSAMMGPTSSATATGPDLRFEFGGLAPGPYALQATFYDGRASANGRLDVTVGDTNVDNLLITLPAPMQVSGEVKVEGAAPGTVNLNDLRVGLRPREQGLPMYAPMPSERPQADGTFTLTHVPPDHLVVGVGLLPEGFYVRSIRMGDQDGLDDGLNFASGAGGLLRIVIAPGAGQIEGVVTNDKQEPMPGVTVVAMPEKEKRRDQFQFVKTANTDQSGRFALKNADPGDYRVYAWEDAESGSWMDPEFLQRSDSKAKKITLREAGRESVELRAIRAEQ